MRARPPVDLADVLEPHVRPLTAHILREIRRGVPGYGPTAAPHRDRIVTGVEQAVLRCVGVVAGRPEPDPAGHGRFRAVFRGFGRSAFEQGRTLDALQAAYRVAGRAGWRYLSDVARSVDLPAELLCRCAEAVFATVDEIAGLSVQGFTDAGAVSVGDRERQRARLLQMLITDPGAAEQEVAAQATTAGWTVPERVVVVALEPVEQDRPLRLDEEVLGVEGRRPCLLAGASGGHLDRLADRLGRRRAAISPSVPVARAGRALECARRALELGTRGVLPNEQVLRCEEHLTGMWLAAEPFLAELLAARVLAPLDPLAERSRARLRATLLAWLQCQGNAIEVAAALGVHPQTVRYRMHQIHELFGSRLQDPDVRFALEVVLRAGAVSNP